MSPQLVVERHDRRSCAGSSCARRLVLAAAVRLRARGCATFLQPVAVRGCCSAQWRRGVGFVGPAVPLVVVAAAGGQGERERAQQERLCRRASRSTARVG